SQSHFTKGNKNMNAEYRNKLINVTRETYTPDPVKYILQVERGLFDEFIKRLENDEAYWSTTTHWETEEDDPDCTLNAETLYTDFTDNLNLNPVLHEELRNQSPEFLQNVIETADEYYSGITDDVTNLSTALLALSHASIMLSLLA